MTPEEQQLRNDLNSALQRITSLEAFKAEKERVQVSFPSDIYSANTNSIMADRYLLDKILDLVWTKYFYYFSQFEINPWAPFVTGTGIVTLDSGVLLQSGATSGSIGEAINQPIGYPDLFFLTADTVQRFRVFFSMSTNANSTVYILRGQTGSAHYGFKIINGEIWGVCSNGGAESLVDTKMTVDTTRTMEVEARLDPLKKVIFYVDRNERGGLASGIPTAFDALGDMQITSSAAGNKNITISSFEYIQARN